MTDTREWSILCHVHAAIMMLHFIAHVIQPDATTFVSPFILQHEHGSVVLCTNAHSRRDKFAFKSRHTRRQIKLWELILNHGIWSVSGGSIHRSVWFAFRQSTLDIMVYHIETHYFYVSYKFRPFFSSTMLLLLNFLQEISRQLNVIHSRNEVSIRAQYLHHTHIIK